MILRKYHPKGSPSTRTVLVLSRDEQIAWFAACCEMVQSRTRYVLDNLENLPEFQVDWEDYHSKNYVRPSRKPLSEKGL